MKFNFNKQIKGGRYFVTISVLEISQDEQDNILKFSSPLVSIFPERVVYKGSRVDELPLHDISHVFVFDNETLADDFLEGMKGKIKEAVEILRTKKDTFSSPSGGEEHEF